MSKEPVKQEARERARTITDDERVELDRRQRTEPDFLEKTRPEDPSPRPGQLTRDNVNPNIPSGPKDRPVLPDGRVDPNAGGIVDPNTLGMEQGGVAPKYPPLPDELRKQREVGEAPAPDQQDAIMGSQYSINEPPGSDVTPEPVEPPTEPPPPAPEGRGKTAKGPEASDDPDEIEDELDQMKEEGEVETRGKPSPKKK